MAKRPPPFQSNRIQNMNRKRILYDFIAIIHNYLFYCELLTRRISGRWRFIMSKVCPNFSKSIFDNIYFPRQNHGRFKCIHRVRIKWWLFKCGQHSEQRELGWMHSINLKSIISVEYLKRRCKLLLIWKKPFISTTLVVLVSKSFLSDLAEKISRKYLNH